MELWTIWPPLLRTERFGAFDHQECAKYRKTEPEGLLRLLFQRDRGGGRGLHSRTRGRPPATNARARSCQRFSERTLSLEATFRQRRFPAQAR
jgi:hypothetical protein